MAFAYKEPAISPTDRYALLGLEPARRAGPTLRRGPLGVSARVIMLFSLVLVDALAAQVAFHLGTALYSALAGGGIAAAGFSARLSAMALTLPLGHLLLDVYRVHGQAPIERFPFRIKATCLLFALLVSWQYATQAVIWPLGAAALTFALVLVLMLMGESIVRTLLIRCRLWGMPTVVIGAGPTGQQVVRVLQQMPELGLRPVGFFDDCCGSDEASHATV
jgi:FlaA1/EpsC-like NDP-sugar epimerase